MNDESHIWAAAYRGKLDVVKEKIQADPKLVHAIDEDGRLPLHWACSAGQTEVAIYLIEAGGKSTLEVPDESKWTPLMIAASAGHIETVRLLLSKGANVNAANENGQTSLHYACSKNRLEVVKLLLQYDAVIDAQDETGSTPLHRCVAMGYINIVSTLCAAGASLTLGDQFQNTALHIAMKESQGEVAAMLITDYNAPINARNKTNRRPIDLAPDTLKQSLKREGVIQ